MTEKADGSNGTIMPFGTSDNSRCHKETCWLLEVRSLPNPPDSVILSPKTKGYVIPQKSRIGQVELVVWGFGECLTGQNQCKYTVHSCGVGCEERGGASPAMQCLTCHLLGLLTRVSACPICPINKCTFAWHSFSPEKLVFKLVMNFEKFVHQIFLNSYLCSHVTSPAQLPLVSGCQNSGAGQSQGLL
jgi:hypothetical protein